MSNELITKETLETAIKGGESIAKVMAGTATELMNGVLKYGAVFVVFYIVKKYFDTMMEADKNKEGMFKALKTSALVAAIIFFTASSFPHITQIGKALVAPKIFLAEKANELRK